MKTPTRNENAYPKWEGVFARQVSYQTMSANPSESGSPERQYDTAREMFSAKRVIGMEYIPPPRRLLPEASPERS